MRRLFDESSNLAKAAAVRPVVLTLLLSAIAVPLRAQDTDVTSGGQAAGLPAPAGASYVPISFDQRIGWIVNGSIGTRSLAVGVLSTSWQTAWNTPEEWGRTWSGAAKRFAAREADVTISNALEAGLGAIWGEEPRYIPSQRHGIGARARYAAKTVFLTQRRDGHLAPAWGRYVGNTLNNVIENAWLPPSVTTPRETMIRSANGFLTRLIGNMYEEFWPDARRFLHRQGGFRRAPARSAEAVVRQPGGASAMNRDRRNQPRSHESTKLPMFSSCLRVFLAASGCTDPAWTVY